jgi:hypothetical protein
MNQSPIYSPSSLERVRDGMIVMDHSGRRLGTVARVRMGDPQAVTTRGEEPPVSDVGVVVAPAEETGGSLGIGAAVPVLGRSLFGAAVPDQLAQELLRIGFVEVDGPELKGPARFVPGDRIIEVSGETVRCRPGAPAAAAAEPGAPPGSARVEPVLHTDLGTPHAPRHPLQLPLAVEAAAIAGVGSLAVLAWLGWRRRRAQQQLLYRVRHSARQLAKIATEQQEISSGLGAVLLLLVFIVSRVLRPRSTDTAVSR